MGVSEYHCEAPWLVNLDVNKTKQDYEMDGGFSCRYVQGYIAKAASVN